MAKDSETILMVKDLTFRYPGGEPVLKTISFALKAGEKTVLLGPNGAGKSTLLFNLLRLYSPEEGEIYLKGKRLKDVPEEFLRQKLAYIFQNPDDQVFAPTVEEDILYGPVQFGIDSKEQKNRLKQVVELLQIKELLKRNPRHLSYGEKRRVALAGVLVMNPEIIFFDEPLAFLDPPGRKLFIKIMEELFCQGKTLLVATHDLNFAAEWGQRFLVLKDGRIIADGDHKILKKGIATFDYSLPIPTQIFQGFVHESQLPLTIKESRELLKNLLL
ncbi:hypothetical protein BBF96_03965 [Anoxybacter fermentans]|uniref:ABC transporter domain-containing protein n=1 Tax=Anoxybacter fermentans TaxID=1323375 RepID=A0A3S9SWD2_9FIRM|nr:ATP-binding cassette domain-containing protein [Anoxybacter fermentans]AZR72616.1 hypothetical protein BBF96_03965 [Anoxybacter fermentans]